jgi:hypothetical protein
MPLVDAVNSATIGANNFEINPIRPENANDSLSAFFIATRFGTSSPKTSVRYDKMRVITITAMLSSKAIDDWGAPNEMINSTRGFEKFRAAKALPKNPDKVIATCIVARNFAG